MTVTAAFFYLFAGITVASAFLVIASRNPVHSVLYLILAFVNSAGLFILLGAEFLAMILIVVYVGAVAVLFLFVIMLLDIDFAELRQGFLQHLPIGGVVGAIFLVELLLVIGAYFAGEALVVAPTVPGASVPAAATPPVAPLTNTATLGAVLYTQYVYFFQIAGLILLVAMIGAIVLTLRGREGVRRQDAARQAARTRETSIELRNVRSREGV